MFDLPLQRTLGLLLAVTALATGASAQSIGANVPRAQPVPLRLQVEQQMADSLWQLGPLRIQPAFKTSVGYHGNLFADEEGKEEHDFGGTLGVGVTFIAPMGEKIFARGTVLPQYTRFIEADLERSSGTYTGELLALFNQMSVQIGGTSSEDFTPVSSEIEAPAVGATDRYWAITKIEIVPRFSLYGAAETSELAFSDDQLVDVGELERLGRDEQILQGGFVYQFRSYLSFATLYETTETRFASASMERDFDSNALLLGIQYDYGRFFLNLSAGPREVEPVLTGTFEPYDTVTGSFAAGYALGAPIVVGLFGNRTLNASAFEDNALFVNQELGSRITGQIGERIRLSVEGGFGENDYPLRSTGDTGPQRRDDISILGAGFGWRLYRNLWLNVDATETRYDSNIDTFDRNVLRIGTTITSSFSLTP